MQGSGSSTFYLLRFYSLSARGADRLLYFLLSAVLLLSACNADGGAGYCPPVHAVDLPMRLRA